jgi:hypothetical protein
MPKLLPVRNVQGLRCIDPAVVHGSIQVSESHRGVAVDLLIAQHVVRDTLETRWASHDERWLALNLSQRQEFVILLVNQQHLRGFAAKLSFEILFRILQELVQSLLRVGSVLE